MGIRVCGGAILSCSFGAAPSSLNVLPAARVMSSMPLASVMDQAPLINILPFGTCTSIANPMVASATAAAFGVLTPMPCIPVILGPWMPGSQNVLIMGKPALTDSSKLNCVYGGVIQIVFPGAPNCQLS